MQKRWRVVVVALALSALAPRAYAAEDFLSDMGWGSLAVVCNVVYVPAKLAWAGVGGLTGSLAYLVTLGDVQTAKRIWQPTLGGTYVLTPAILKGEEPLIFSPQDEPPRVRRRRLEER
jgi:hypothetical protein